MALRDDPSQDPWSRLEIPSRSALQHGEPTLRFEARPVRHSGPNSRRNRGRGFRHFVYVAQFPRDSGTQGRLCPSNMANAGVRLRRQRHELQRDVADTEIRRQSPRIASHNEPREHLHGKIVEVGFFFQVWLLQVWLL